MYFGLIRVEVKRERRAGSTGGLKRQDMSRDPMFSPLDPRVESRRSPGH